MLLVLVLLHRLPGGAGREAGGLEAARSRAVALIVIGIHAARVVRVIPGLLDVAHQVAARVNGLQIADFAVQCPRGALELVLVEGRVEQGRLERLQCRTVGARGLVIEHALGIHVLVGLRQQKIPILVELVQSLDAYALVRDGVDVVADLVGVVDRGAAGRHAKAGIGQTVRAFPIDRRIVRIVDAEVGVCA